MAGMTWLAAAAAKRCSPSMSCSSGASDRRRFRFCRRTSQHSGMDNDICLGAQCMQLTRYEVPSYTVSQRSVCKPPICTAASLRPVPSSVFNSMLPEGEHLCIRCKRVSMDSCAAGWWTSKPLDWLWARLHWSCRRSWGDAERDGLRVRHGVRHAGWRGVLRVLRPHCLRGCWADVWLCLGPWLDLCVHLGLCGVPIGLDWLVAKQQVVHCAGALRSSAGSLWLCWAPSAGSLQGGLVIIALLIWWTSDFVPDIPQVCLSRWLWRFGVDQSLATGVQPEHS